MFQYIADKSTTYADQNNNQRISDVLVRKFSS
ncbi:hypothetical protein T03_4514 [Trichinella britovi]|uniref:Uncharacterized protein n=1 Tax=Trichinella britovi TaxID=45882 RepID=A0A0V0YW26_TRIBR|nr:hypothetical protein T03_4514 [Trichinella britovi]